jgi:hypothetical protein
LDSEDIVGFFGRLGLAFGLFFKIIFNADAASKVAGALTSQAPPSPGLEPTQSSARKTPEPPKGTEALQLLAALQREGRFLDFVKEDVQGLSDDDVGGAARIVHEGCKKIISKWFTIDPIWPGEDGAPVTLEEGFDARRIQLTGNVTGEPPFSGTLVHHGWSASNTKLPTLNKGADPKVLAPAEVEL